VRIPARTKLEVREHKESENTVAAVAIRSLFALELCLTMVTQVLPYRMVEVLEYLDQNGCSPFANWFNGLDAQAAAKVSAAQTKLGLGNWSNVKGVGNGVYERVIDFGPGYRIYFGKDGDRVSSC